MYGKSIKDMKKFIVSFCGLLCCVWPSRLSARGMAFVLQAGRAAGVELSPSEKPVVHRALSILQRDVRAVLGDSLRILPAGGDIVAGTVGEGGLVEKTGADLDALEGRKQAFLLSVLHGIRPDGSVAAVGCLAVGMVGGCHPRDSYAL